MRTLTLIIMVTAILSGCSGSSKVEMGPAETVQSFYEALWSGNITDAESYCDSLGMSGYVESYRTAWEKNSDTISDIVTDILSETEIRITDTERNGQIRTVFYELAGTDGRKKEKAATLRKEEGEWKIEAITDRH
jgi:hypothetical protein